MYIRIASLAVISFFLCNPLSGQSDTLQRIETDEGIFYLINDSFNKRLIFHSGFKQIVVLGNKDLTSTKSSRASVVDGIVDLKISNGIVGILYLNNYSLLYSLLDLNLDDRKLINGNFLFKDQNFRSKCQLLNPFTLYEQYLDFPDKSKISIYSKDRKVQIFEATSGIIDHNKMKGKRGKK